jgi:hypothetical protein
MAATPPTALPQPGVQIIQQLAKTTPSFTLPTLIPAIVGPAYEVTNVLNTDGSVNAGDKFGSYTQVGLYITESSFPAPRNNADELVVQAGSVEPFMLAGGVLTAMPLSPYGSAMLDEAHFSTRPVFRTAIFSGGTGLALAGQTLVIAVDQPVPANTTQDVVITFQGSGNLTSATAAAQINEAAGQNIAVVVGTAPNDAVEIGSLGYGATASITVRAGGSANQTLNLGYASSSAAHEERVEGAGWRGQDQNNNTTKTPWIQFYQGAYLLDRAATTPPVTTPVEKVGWYNVITNTVFDPAVAPAVNFGTTSGKIPLNVGDQFYSDGINVGSAYVMKVEGTRFKLGTLDTTLSIIDSQGHVTSAVYDAFNVGTILDPSPFAPKYTYFIANNLNWQAVAPSAATIQGSIAATDPLPAIVAGVGAGSGPFALAGLNLQYTVISAGVSTEGTFTFTGGPFANMTAVAAAVSIPGVAATAVGGQLTLTTLGEGASYSITLQPSGTANSVLGFSTVSATQNTGADPTFSTLAATTLQVQFDNNPHVYSITFADTSLYDAITEINSIVGSTVASFVIVSGHYHIVLTAPLAGLASNIDVIVPSPTGAETILGLIGAVTAGSGRPFPNAYLDNASVLHIGPEILRDTVTGNPLDQQYNMGSLYIQYTALRLDVSPVAQHAAVLNLTDTTTLGTVLNPLTGDNPLGLASFLCLLNCPGFTIKALGISEVSGTAPYGTTTAWAQAATMLEAEEVYAIAPLTQDPTIHGLWQTHVDTMSEPTQGGERIVFINPIIPTQANPTVALSGTQGASTAVPNTFLCDGNPAPGLLAAGIPTPLTTIAESENVYVTFTLNGELVNYNVAGANGALLTLRTTFSDPATNASGFYETAPLTETVVDAAYSLEVMGAPLVIPGSNPPLPDLTAISNTIGEANIEHHDRRVYSVHPDTVQVVVEGVTENLPGFYACAAIAGMVGALPPQQGFTNYPITGLAGVVGPKFTKDQLNVMAGGGTYIIMQDVQNGPIFSRHQLSTDLDSIETRELSITKVVDFTAKILRAAVRKFIGVNVINQGLLDALGTTIQAVLQFLQTTGVLNGSNLNQIIQDASAPDTVLGSITLDVPYPCNYIMLTLAF